MMASILTIAGFFAAAAAFAGFGAEAATQQQQHPANAAVLYTTGGQGFHRQLHAHVPLVPSSAADEASASATHSAFSVTLSLRLRNTFFIDVAEAENQWDSRVLAGATADAIAADFASGLAAGGASPSRGGNAFVESITLQHPIVTQYPFDIEIPTVKSPYLFNVANVTFDIVVDNAKVAAAAAAASSSASQSVVAVLSIPFHERYEDVTTDPTVTHVERCLAPSDVTIFVNAREGDSRNSPLTVAKRGASIASKKTERFAAALTSLPVRFSQKEDGAAIVRDTAAGTVSEAFCVRVPVGFLGDLPFFYWGTMSMMVIGATAVWAGLTFV